MLDKLLYKTRKSVLEVAAELGHNNVSLADTELQQCSSCGIWLYPKQLIKDLDESLICKDCETYYGL